MSVANWEPWLAAKRDQELRPGDVVVYDEGVSFLSDFFSPDFRTRVEFVSSDDAAAFLARVQADQARWVAVRTATPAEAALRLAGATFLADMGALQLYRFGPSPQASRGGQLQ